MAIQFETLGNATLTIFFDGKPVISTDPWLKGKAYFESWAFEKPLTESQIQNVIQSPFIMISHSHPDHLHAPSIKMLSTDSLILVPDHYHSSIQEYFKSKHFKVKLLKYKQWTRITPEIQVMALPNEDQDAILIIEVGDALILDLNDSMWFGEGRFLKKLVKQYKKTFLLSLCSIDADMSNFVNEKGEQLLGDPDERKPGTIQQVSDLCSYLKVRYYCCFSSQHQYTRPDSIWATPYHITWEDMKHNWNSLTTQMIEPFVTVNLSGCSITPNHPGHQVDKSLVSQTTGNDDWTERMTNEDWQAVEKYILRFVLLRRHLDFIRFTVAGESRTFVMNKRGARKSPQKQKGVNFILPRQSLMQTVKYGYFDDLLIGNFMKTQLFNVTLYPHISPVLGKLGGPAQVFTALDLWKFRAHYFFQSPTTYIIYHLRKYWWHQIKPMFREFLRRLRMLESAKRLARRLSGLPPHVAGRISND